jgi:tRNA pseudouridine55 synthase
LLTGRLAYDDRFAYTGNMFGVLNLNKPAGMTSHDVIDHCRRVLGMRKIGHLGTLDPMATGVLPVCVGMATRLIEFFPTDKAYIGQVTFGHITDSWDADGQILASQPAHHINATQVADLLTGMHGVVQQTIPMRSAKHIRGKKMYQYAIAGQTLDLPTKTVTVHKAELLHFDAGEYPVATIAVACSTGTYIRSIANALGQQLGVGAHLSALQRTSHGQFLLTNSVPLAELSAETPLLSPLPYLTLPRLPIADLAVWQAIQHGKKLHLPQDFPSAQIKTNQRYVATLNDTDPVAILEAESQTVLKPVKVLPYV